MNTGRWPSNLRQRIQHWNFSLLFQLWIFLLILLVFQLGWESFEKDITAFPPLVRFSDFIGNLVLFVTPSILNPVFELEIERAGISLILPNGFYVSYFFYLSGIKQMAFVLIMLLLMPGPWKKKIWYIPICLVIVTITVFIRFLMLTLHCVIYPEHIHLIQIMLFGPLFYLEIVVMWATWVLIIARTAALKPTTGTE